MEQFPLFILAEGTLLPILPLHVHAHINDLLEKPKGCLKYPDCRYSLGPAAFVGRLCCFGIPVGSEAPSCNPTNLPPTASAQKGAAAEAGRESHTFILSQLKNG